MVTYAIKGNEKVLVTPENKDSLVGYKFIQKSLSEREIEKKEKKEAIEKIASISDQLNLTAGTLDIVVDLLAKTNPEILNNPWIIESKQKLNEIKNILYK